MNQVLDEFAHFYRSFSAESVKELGKIYSNDVRFVDPLGEHIGLQRLRGYFYNVMTNTQSCEFDILSVDTLQNQAYITWVMHYQHPKVSNGERVSVDGITHLKIDNDKISYHRDYYDMGQMLYQHLPLLGWAVSKINQRMVQS